MAAEKTKGTIDAREYMNLRKVLSDKDYYLDKQNSAEISDMIVLLKDAVCGGPPEKVTADNRHEASILALYRENRQKACANLSEGDRKSKNLSKETIDTLKVYADFCFYHEHPELFNDLCMAVYNDAAPVKFGPIEMPGSTTFPRTYESTYRMLFYDRIRARAKDGTKAELFSPDIYPFIEDFMDKFEKGEPTSFYDAYAAFENFKGAFLLRQFSTGRRVVTHIETDLKRLYYFTSEAFDAERIAADSSGGMKIEENSAAPELARDMSRYSYYREPDPQTAHKNIVRRAFFDAIAKAGELPREVTAEDARTYSLRECLNDMGPEEFLSTADAAFFMHDNPREYKEFLLVQKLYDGSAQQ